MLLSSVLNALDDIRHGTRAVGAEHLDSNDVGLLGDTILLTGDSARAVSAVTIAILVSVISGDSLAPGGATLKVDVVNVGASIDDINIDALTAAS